jgi:hypothetical protein
MIAVMKMPLNSEVSALVLLTRATEESLDRFIWLVVSVDSRTIPSTGPTGEKKRQK